MEDPVAHLLSFSSTEMEELDGVVLPLQELLVLTETGSKFGKNTNYEISSNVTNSKTDITDTHIL